MKASVLSLIVNTNNAVLDEKIIILFLLHKLLSWNAKKLFQIKT